MLTRTGKHSRKNRPGGTGMKAGVAFVLLLALIVVAPRVTRPQTAAPTAAKPLPQRVLYQQLFNHVTFLNQQAALAVQNGKDGSPYSNFYQSRAQLTAAETAALKQAAQNATASVQAINSQIQTQVALFRQQFAGVKPLSKKPPAPPPILATLQGQKDAAILAQVSALQAAMGAARFQQFDAVVQTVLAPHITVSKMGAARAPGTVGVTPLPPGTPGH